MAYIQPNTKWYLADMVIDFKIDGQPNHLVHVNLRLIRADSPEEAYEKAIRLGRQDDISYVNTDGDSVTVVFKGLRNLYGVCEEIEDGAELLYEEIDGVTEDAINKLVRPKSELAVFLS